MDSLTGERRRLSTSFTPVASAFASPIRLSSEESVLRATLITGLVRAWAKNYERGTGDVVLAEFGVVFEHPSETDEPTRRPRRRGGRADGELAARKRTRDDRSRATR